MKKSFKQLFNGILVFIGAGFLIYSMTVTGVSPYIQVVGLIILMVGVYRASSYWAKHKNDHLDE